jgi:hypothetical protein
MTHAGTALNNSTSDRSITSTSARGGAIRWVRAFAAFSLAVLALLTTLVSPASADASRVFHVAPNGTAGADGSSWTRAGKLTDLARFVRLAEPGDEVWIRGDAGAYKTNSAIVINAGGDVSNPVVVRGVAADGSSNARPTFVGTRTAPYRPNGKPGTELFRLLAGADNLEFDNLEFVNQGNGAFRVGADISNLTIRNVRATNVRRFFESQPSGKERSATISGLHMSDVTVDGFSRGVIRLADDTHDVVIQDVTGDSQRQDGDQFAIGVHLVGTVHDVLFERVTMRNSHDTVTAYWNGDGFAAERGTYNVQFVDTVATGNTDSGYDLKSESTTLVRAIAEDNKRNFRFWAQAELIDSVGRNPYRRGGTGSQAQVWAGSNARVHITNSTFTDQHAGSVVFEVDDTAQVTLENTGVIRAPNAKEAIVKPGARLLRK